MAPLDSIARGDVIRTIAEYNGLGRDTFLTTHGFENAHAYVLMHEGFGYDSHAVVGVAHRYSTVKQDEPTEFCGGEDGAAQVLRDLGFVVRGGAVGEQPAHTNAADVGIESAQQAWLQAGRQVLIETAKSYHAVVTT